MKFPVYSVVWDKSVLFLLTVTSYYIMVKLDIRSSLLINLKSEVKVEVVFFLVPSCSFVQSVSQDQANS